jgi:hypothetical protein
MEFPVCDGRLLDGNRAALVMRGVNYLYAWYAGRYPTGTRHDLAAVNGRNRIRETAVTATVFDASDYLSPRSELSVA